MKEDFFGLLTITSVKVIITLLSLEVMVNWVFRFYPQNYYPIFTATLCATKLQNQGFVCI